MQRLAFSRFTGLTSLYSSPLIKSFLKSLFLIIRRLPVTICLWYLSTKGELLYLHSRLSGFVKNKSKSRLLKKLIEIKNLSRHRWSQFVSNHWYRKFNRDLTVPGSSKIEAKFISSTPLFLKNIVHIDVVSSLT